MKPALSFIEAGACTHPEWTVMQGGKNKIVRFPSSVAVIKHPLQGVILFDSGYSPEFFLHTKKLPAALYRYLTPVEIDEKNTARAQLKEMGISHKDVRFVIVSHFHADHIGGLKDFPSASYICFEHAYRHIESLRGMRALVHGFLPGLMPQDFSARSRFLSLSECQHVPFLPPPFQNAIDLFGDQSIFVVELPGHARGQAGIFVFSEEGSFFLVSDACWLKESFEQNKMPHGITRLIQDNFKVYQETLSGLHQIHLKHKHFQIVPCHCSMRT